MRLGGCGTHRVDPGKGSVRSGGLRADSVPQSAYTLRQVASTTAVAESRLGTRHRTVVFCTTCRQDADRDTHQGHDAKRNIVQLVLHVSASINA